MPVPLSSLKGVATAEESPFTPVHAPHSHLPVLSLLHPLSLTYSITLSSYLIGGHPLTFSASILPLCILFVNSLSSILSNCPNHLCVLRFTISTTTSSFLFLYWTHQIHCIHSHYFYHPFCSQHILLSNN